MTIQEESLAILDLVGGDLSRAVQIVQNQLDVLYSRAQVLTSLAGIVVTVTGFSGRLIAATNPPAQFLVIAGLAIVLCSAFFVIRRAMHIRWVTCELSPDKAGTIGRILATRNQKTQAIRIGGLLLFSGLFFYFLAFALMLTNPVPMTLPVR